jgi:hypothetical protein
VFSMKWQSPGNGRSVVPLFITSCMFFTPLEKFVWKYRAIAGKVISYCLSVVSSASLMWRVWRNTPFTEKNRDTKLFQYDRSSLPRAPAPYVATHVSTRMIAIEKLRGNTNRKPAEMFTELHKLQQAVALHPFPPLLLLLDQLAV